MNVGKSQVLNRICLFASVERNWSCIYVDTGRGKGEFPLKAMVDFLLRGKIKAHLN